MLRTVSMKSHMERTFDGQVAPDSASTGYREHEAEESGRELPKEGGNQVRGRKCYAALTQENQGSVPLHR